MKKIYSILLASILILSCDMDKSPYGDLDDKTAIQSLNDTRRLRNGLYSGMRGLTTGGYVYLTDIQMDIFQGVVGNGNRKGPISDGSIMPSETSIEGTWKGCYAVINSANYLLEKTEKLMTDNKYTDEELATLKQYDGEAHFIRAFCYYWLVDHFCESYTAANAQTPAKGLPLTTVYYPTGDMSKYPGRSTQSETYDLIEKDLVAAYEALKAYESIDKTSAAPDATYFSSYAVLALQARVALLKGDNATALAKAEAIIGSNVYSLSGLAEYADIWRKDTGKEIIFRSFMAKTELGGSTGMAYLSPEENFADYIPTYGIRTMYDSKDVRHDAFFTTWELMVGGSKIKAKVFKKYPGNEALKTSVSPNYVNMSKPFRLSEIYLIAAEAAATGTPDKANKYLNDLRAKRIKDYVSKSYSGQELVQQIRVERFKELLGEGYRMSDLRRWGLGFSRRPDHPDNPAIESALLITGKGLSYPVGDHRFVWPIPAGEISANPQLSGQQNPGY